MVNNPYDDAFKNLARVMEELISNLSLDESTHFIGCTIISGSGDDTRIFQIDPAGEEAVNYEIVDGPDTIFITAELPPGIRSEPYADIQKDKVRIFIDDEEIAIDLPSTINIGQSHYEVKHGVMDIVCKKIS